MSILNKWGQSKNTVLYIYSDPKKQIVSRNPA